MRSNASLFGVLMILVAGAAVSGAPRSLVDRSLARSHVDLLGWNETSVAYLDEFGQVRREPIENYVAILPAGEAGRGGWARPTDDELAGGTPVVVELTDGQRLIGSVGPWGSASVAGEAPDGERIQIVTPGFGSRVIPLDRVGRVVIDPWTRGQARHRGWTAGVDDELILVNGDRLRGFLVAFGESIAFDAGDGERPFTLDRVAEIRLGNPGETWHRPRVWWRGGTIRDARASGDRAGGGVRLVDEGADEPLMFPIDDITSAWLDRGGLIPLGALTVGRYEPGEGRRWTRGPEAGSVGESPLGTPHVELPGPMRAVWSIPAEASRLGTIARLGASLDDPTATPGRWAHAVVRVSISTRAGETVLAEVELDRGRPTAPISVALPGVGEAGRVLVVELDEGLYGPIHDRVLLDRPMLVGF